MVSRQSTSRTSLATYIALNCVVLALYGYFLLFLWGPGAHAASLFRFGTIPITGTIACALRINGIAQYPLLLLLTPIIYAAVTGYIAITHNRRVQTQDNSHPLRLTIPIVGIVVLTGIVLFLKATLMVPS